ncbi:EpsG family protein [Flexistipes sinusarabici]|nr:EpsG family protein [Flexistipes sinusarabici]
MGKSANLYKRYGLEYNGYLFIALTVLLGYLLILFAGFKPIGFDPDSANYVKLLQTDPANFDLNKVEPLNCLIVFINQKFFNTSAESFFLIYGFLYVSLSLVAIKRYSIKPIFSLIVFILLFFPNFGLIQIRQGISIAIFLLAIGDIVNRNAYKFMLKIAIAILFHYSAVVFLVFYFIVWPRLTLVQGLILPLLCLLVGEFLLTYNFYITLSEFLPGAFGWKMTMYLELMAHADKTDGSIHNINPFNMYSLFMWLLVILSTFLNKSDLRGHFNILLNILFGGLLFWFLFITVPVFSFRIFVTLSSVSILLIPYILEKIYPQFLSITLFFIAILILSVNVYLLGGLFYFSLLL